MNRPNFHRKPDDPSRPTGPSDPRETSAPTGGAVASGCARVRQAVPGEVRPRYRRRASEADLGPSPGRGSLRVRIRSGQRKPHWRAYAPGWRWRSHGAAGCRDVRRCPNDRDDLGRGHRPPESCGDDGQTNQHPRAGGPGKRSPAPLSANQSANCRITMEDTEAGTLWRRLLRVDRGPPQSVLGVGADQRGGLL